MKILFCGGGTAGHIHPALTVAEAVREIGGHCAFVGREEGGENGLITSAGFPLYTIHVQGLRRSLSLDNISALIHCWKSIKESKRILRSFAPDVVFGTGGYVTFPVVYAAQQMHLPTVLHESNAIPGLVTRLLAKKCRTVFLGMSGAEDKYPLQNNLLLTGNPVRRDFCTTRRIEARRKLGLKQQIPMILSFGGSGGAEKINEACLAMMEEHALKRENVYHFHATGERYFAMAKQRHPSLFTEGKQKILPYIHDMPLYMNAADIVICRAGAMTTAEVCAAGVCAILIPSPNVAEDHQRKNARRLVALHAAEAVLEEDLEGGALQSTVHALLKDPARRLALARGAHALYDERTVENILARIKEIGEI